MKVLFHDGDDLSLSTKGQTGRLTLSPESICIFGSTACVVSFELLRSVELLRMHKVGSVIKVTYAGGTLFLTVIRFSLFGLFALVNRNATRRLAEELQGRIPKGPFG